MTERDLGAYAAHLARDWESRFGSETASVLDGTLLKVDLSGFTRLSERLARTGRTGAEEVNAVIDAISPLGVRHADMPLTPANVWMAMQGHPMRTDLAVT